MTGMNALLEEARTTGKWLWTSYQDLWFAPDDLARLQQEGQFRWGPVNWKLRDPMERIRELEGVVEDAQRDLVRFRKRLGQ